MSVAPHSAGSKRSVFPHSLLGAGGGLSTSALVCTTCSRKRRGGLSSENVRCFRTKMYAHSRVLCLQICGSVLSGAVSADTSCGWVLCLQTQPRLGAGMCCVCRQSQGWVLCLQTQPRLGAPRRRRALCVHPGRVTTRDKCSSLHDILCEFMRTLRFDFEV